MAQKKLSFKKWKIVFEHDIIIDLIKNELKGSEINLKKQIEKFHSDPSYKEYTGIRKDKGYNKWKADVLSRFVNTCCVCLSKENIIAHHLFSYKYYPELRVNLNNGVCLCTVCHDNFNDIYSNASTLKQFIEFREEYKGKTRKRFSIVQFISEKESEKMTTKKSTLKIVLTLEQEEIIKKFEELKMSLSNERQQLEKKYGKENGIKINFRDKITTSKSAITTLQNEVMRINRLNDCNKMPDKTIMAKEFHMPLNEFLSILEDPNQYLKFTNSEIVHLGLILQKNYTKEMKALLTELNSSISRN